MDKKEYEEIEKKANNLQHNAVIQHNLKVQKEQSFFDGYQQGIEDFLRYIRTEKLSVEDLTWKD